MLVIAHGWFRTKVYMLGHTEGDRTWLASFKNPSDALLFVRARQSWSRVVEDDPVDAVPSP